MKTATKVDRSVLEKCLKEAESKNVFPTLTALWEDVARLYNLHNYVPTKIKAGVVYLRVKEWGLSYQTKPGKRGKPSNLTGPRKPRGEKFKSNPKVVSGMKELKKTYPAHVKKIDKILSGSMKSAIKMKCIDCCAGQVSEVRLCEINDCPLWPFR